MMLAGEAAAASDYTLNIFGNANMDDTIDEDDITYVEGIIKGTNEETELADANYDGEVDEDDITQIKLIISGEEKELTIIDSIDRIVTVRVPVERIIPLHMRHAAAVCVLGAEDKIVGVDNTVVEHERLFPELSKLPSVGTVREPDVEQIIVLDPDLIITFTNFPISDLLEDKLPESISVVRFDLSRVEDMDEEMKKLGYILGEKKYAEEYLEWYDHYMETVKERVYEISVEDRVKVLMEREKKSGEETTVRWAYATDTGYTDLCDVAGGINIARGQMDYHGDIESEWVISQNPDVIIGLSYKGGYKKDDKTPFREYREEIMSIPGFENVEAVKTDRVHIISGDFSIGPQLPIGVVTVAKWLYPDRFEDLDTQTIHKEFLTEFMHVDYDLDQHGVFVYPPMEES
ncbi:MAG: ABC transporter substrate-binding protein [Methanotrichaceae archaeon]